VRFVTPRRLIGAGVVLVAAVVGVLWLVPTGYYVLLPDPAHPVEPLVRVGKANRGDDDPGGIYFVDVIQRKATVLERLFPGLRDGSTLVREDQVKPQGFSDEDLRRLGLREMQRSQSVAAAVALEAAGRDGLVVLDGVEVTGLAERAPAAAQLRRGDRILAVDGRAARTICTLQRLLARRRPGDTVRVSVRRDGAVRTVRVRTIGDPGTGRTLLGIAGEPDVRVRKLPVPVRIDLGAVGGPSAGLAFALEVLEKLGRDVDRGLKVAVTGTIEPDGCVGAIGGVKQKTIGARRADVDVFLVPAGENAAEARRYADGLRIIPVNSFRQALQALETLPQKA
jgi:PDZ domain-containing protein